MKHFFFVFAKEIRIIFYQLPVNKPQIFIRVRSLANCAKVKHWKPWHKHRQKSVSGREFVSDSVMTIKQVSNIYFLKCL